MGAPYGSRRTPRLVVLSGPSGVGKSTVVRELRLHYPQVWVSISATTRFPRPGEVNGVHYRFLTRPEFEQQAAAAEFLEWAEFHGNLYGTPREPVLTKLEHGVPVLLEIDLQGARQVRAAMPDALLVFLAPPSWEELVRRLSRRGTEGPDAVDDRLKIARAEIAAESEFDVRIVNNDVGAVCRELLALMGSPVGDSTFTSRSTSTIAANSEA